ncbi:MAG: hypothetical protein AAB706_01965 [Patescibacteria group bacterium]
MWAVISSVIQIIFLLLKNKFEKDADLKKKKEELHVEAKKAIISGDVSRINMLVTKLR